MNAMTVRRAPPIFTADVKRCLAGVVCVVGGRDRVSSEPFFQVDHISRGGDIGFRSKPIADEDRAREAAQVLAQFTNSVMR